MHNWRRRLRSGVRRRAYGDVPLTRRSLRAITEKQRQRLESRVSKRLEPHFRDVIDTVVRLLTDMPDAESYDATLLADAIVPVGQATKDLLDVGLRSMIEPFVVGVRSEYELRSSKTVSAQVVADLLEVELLDNLWVGEFPKWMIDAAATELSKTFAQSYWNDIHTATRNDIELTLYRGIDEGLSTRKVAALILGEHDATYTRARAMNIARTETGNILNSGHAAGMSQIENELGVPIGKEWLSVQGTTTRPSHSAMNGVRTDTSDGMFNLAGYEVPWPSHHSLPASERCNCQCTIISVSVFDDE